MPPDDDLREIGWEGAVNADSTAAFLDDLRALGAGPAPAPSAELAALLQGARPLHRAPIRIGRRVLASALIAAVVALFAAAGTQRLPAPARRVVSDVIEHLSPFHLDGIPHERPGAAARPPVDTARVEAQVKPPAVKPRAGKRPSNPAPRTAVPPHTATGAWPVLSAAHRAHHSAARPAHPARHGQVLIAHRHRAPHHHGRSHHRRHHHHHHKAHHHRHHHRHHHKRHHHHHRHRHDGRAAIQA